MATISLCMIVKNEEEVLESCLSNVKDACDEIIIVDTGSEDRTKDIAREYTNKILDFEWVDDFSAARNFAFSHATKDFIMWLDADDILKEEDLKKLLTIKKNLSMSIDAVSMKYHIAFNELGNPTFSYRRNRLVKRVNGFQWHGVVHEYLEVSGNVVQSDIGVTHSKHLKKKGHDVGRNLRIYEKRLKQGILFSPRELYYYSNELRENGQFEKAIDYYNEFLATKKGWIEDNIRACLYLADCYSNLGEKEEGLNALLYSLQYDEPRPEICCRLGDYFNGQEAYETAVFWFTRAIEAPIKDNGAFVEIDYSTYYPHLQLCVCYWQLGKMEKSYKHNKMAGKYRPNDPSVDFNNRFFADYFGSDEKKKILYIGWIGHKNLGDDLMWDLFKEQFDQRFEGKLWEIDVTIRKSAKEYNLDEYDLVVLGGGSIICENNIPVLYNAIKKGKDVVIWGSGMDLIFEGHIHYLQSGQKINLDQYFSKSMQEKLRFVVDHAKFIGVRGPLTYEILKQIGANEEKLIVGGDPGLLLSKGAKEYKEISETLQPFKGNKIIGINWGTTFNYLYGMNEEHVEDELVSAVHDFIKQGYKIYLYTVWNQDNASIQRLYDKINDIDNVILDMKLHDQNYLMSLISNFHFTINFKLHANLISLGAGTPPILLGYRFKVFDFSQSVGLRKLTISTGAKGIRERLNEIEIYISLERDHIMKEYNQKKMTYIDKIIEPFDKNLYLDEGKEKDVDV